MKSNRYAKFSRPRVFPQSMTIPIECAQGCGLHTRTSLPACHSLSVSLSLLPTRSPTASRHLLYPNRCCSSTSVRFPMPHIAPCVRNQRELTTPVSSPCRPSPPRRSSIVIPCRHRPSSVVRRSSSVVRCSSSVVVRRRCVVVRRCVVTSFFSSCVAFVGRWSLVITLPLKTPKSTVPGSPKYNIRAPLPPHTTLHTTYSVL